MKSFTNMFADLLNDGRPGRSSSTSSSSSAAAAQQARGGRSTTGSRSASTAWESFDEPSSSSSSSGFAAPTPATTHPGFPAPIRGVARPEDGVHPLTREWADRIGNRAVRDAFLEHPIGDYTESHRLNVWTGSWNTNGKRPPPNLDISQWLDVDASQPDIVVVGFQEIVPLTPGKVLAVEDEKATKEWEAIIERALHKGGVIRCRTSPRSFIRRRGRLRRRMDQLRRRRGGSMGVIRRGAADREPRARRTGRRNQNRTELEFIQPAVHSTGV